MMAMNIEIENDLAVIHTYLSTGMVEGQTQKGQKLIKLNANYFLLYDGRMYRRTLKGLRFVIKQGDRFSIMKGLHNGIGHRKFLMMHFILSESFWWPTLKPQMVNFV